MIRYVGLDVHKRFIEVCILDDQGKVLFRGRADCEREALERFSHRRLKKSDRVALDATTNTWPIVEILRPFVAAIVVGNPLKTKAIAKAKIKTDKIDAEVLASLTLRLSSGRFPSAPCLRLTVALTSGPNIFSTAGRPVVITLRPLRPS